MEPKAGTVPSYQQKMSAAFLVTFAIEQSPGKKAIFLSESQFFKVRSDGYVSAALDCDKSHQTALTPSSMTSPMSPMSKCSWESIPWSMTWRRFSWPITKPVRPRTKTNLWHSLRGRICARMRRFQAQNLPPWPHKLVRCCLTSAWEPPAWWKRGSPKMPLI